MLARVDKEAIYLCLLKKKKRKRERLMSRMSITVRCSVFDYRLKATISMPTSIFHVRFLSQGVSPTKVKRVRRRLCECKRLPTPVLSFASSSPFFTFYRLCPLARQFFSCSSLFSFFSLQKTKASVEKYVRTYRNIIFICPMIFNSKSIMIIIFYFLLNKRKKILNSDS